VFEPTETVTNKTDFFKKQVTAETIKAYKTTDISARGISKGIAEQYGVKMTFDSDGDVDTHYYPYEDGKAYKIRKLPKEFTRVGKSTDLFGRTLFPAGGKRVIIVEGEIDTLSMAQASWDKYKRLYPVLPNLTVCLHEVSSIATLRLWEARMVRYSLC
jgi:hypothetical protein